MQAVCYYLCRVICGVSLCVVRIFHVQLNTSFPLINLLAWNASESLLKIVTELNNCQFDLGGSLEELASLLLVFRHIRCLSDV